MELQYLDWKYKKFLVKIITSVVVASNDSSLSEIKYISPWGQEVATPAYLVSLSQLFK